MIKDSLFEVMNEEVCRKNYEKMLEIFLNLKNTFCGLKKEIIEKNNSLSSSHNSNLDSILHKQLTVI